MKLRVRVKDVYGTPTVYPVCEKAKLFAEIAGTKTLTHATLTRAERLGFTIEQEPSPALSFNLLRVDKTIRAH